MKMETQKGNRERKSKGERGRENVKDGERERERVRERLHKRVGKRNKILIELLFSLQSRALLPLSSLLIEFLRV